MSLFWIIGSLFRIIGYIRFDQVWPLDLSIFCIIGIIPYQWVLWIWPSLTSEFGRILDHWVLIPYHSYSGFDQVWPPDLSLFRIIRSLLCIIRYSKFNQVWPPNLSLFQIIGSLFCIIGYIRFDKVWPLDLSLFRIIEIIPYHWVLRICSSLISGFGHIQNHWILIPYHSYSGFDQTSRSGLIPDQWVLILYILALDLTKFDLQI